MLPLIRPIIQVRDRSKMHFFNARYALQLGSSDSSTRYAPNASSSTLMISTPNYSPWLVAGVYISWCFLKSTHVNPCFAAFHHGPCHRPEAIPPVLYFHISPISDKYSDPNCDPIHYRSLRDGTWWDRRENSSIPSTEEKLELYVERCTSSINQLEWVHYIMNICPIHRQIRSAKVALQSLTSSARRGHSWIIQWLVVCCNQLVPNIFQMYSHHTTI